MRIRRRKPGDLAFGSETYRAGALERIEDARLLKESGRLALSMYASGLAVEGMLRSLQRLKSREFDERHDLRKLAVRVQDLGLLKSEHEYDFVGVVEEVAATWHNNLRFADEAQLWRF